MKRTSPLLPAALLIISGVVTAPPTPAIAAPQPTSAQATADLGGATPATLPPDSAPTANNDTTHPTTTSPDSAAIAAPAILRAPLTATAAILDAITGSPETAPTANTDPASNAATSPDSAPTGAAVPGSALTANTDASDAAAVSTGSALGAAGTPGSAGVAPGSALASSTGAVEAAPGSVISAAAVAAVGLPGLVLTSAAASLPASLSAVGTAKRVQYVSTDANGALIPATGLILTPKTNKQNRVVVWAHGTTGLADRCAPSANQDVFWPEAQVAVAELLRRGWTVAAPDYPGLGTVLPHPYLVGISEGRSIIDSVRAARNLDSALSLRYAIDGHSQGGQGALFASQLAPSYDGTLVLAGTASIAPVSNVDVLAPLIPGTPGQGYLVMGLYGLAAVDPTFNPNTVLAAPAKAKTAVLATGCLMEILTAYQSLTATELLVGGALPAAVVAKLKQHDNPAQTAPSAPMLIVQGTDDDAVPQFLTHDYLLPQLRAYAQPVDYIEVANATHDTAVIETAPQVADWLAARLG